MVHILHLHLKNISLVEHLKKENFNHFYEDLKFWQIHRFIQKNNIHLIHCHSKKSFLFCQLFIQSTPYFYSPPSCELKLASKEASQNDKRVILVTGKNASIQNPRLQWTTNPESSIIDAHLALEGTSAETILSSFINKVPVVAEFTEAHQSLLVHGKTALVAMPNDWKMIETHIENTVFLSSELMARQIEEAYLSAQPYTIESWVKKIWLEYDLLLKNFNND
jgi:hypothetical protein